MFQRQKTGSVLCPNCGSLVGVNDASCYTCGRKRPGLFGFAGLLRNTGEDMGFVWLVTVVCAALYILTFAISPHTEEELMGGGLLGFLSPHWWPLMKFGATGRLPVFEAHRWWTVLSYAWLHGGLLHVVFNLAAARSLVPLVAHLYGPARTVIIYIGSAAGGAVLTSAVAEYARFLPDLLDGGAFTVGASGAIFGMVGALSYYGKRGGSRMIADHAWGWIISGALIGFMPGFRVDNWCHLGGLGAGYIVARWLDPLHPERGDHVIVAVALLALSAISIVVSLLVGLPSHWR